MAETIPTFCRICEATCGLLADVDGERVVALRPDPDHPISQGYACVKGPRYLELHESPDRVRTPLKRVAGAFVPISWETAFEEIGGRLARLREEFGPHAIGTYLGNPSAFSTTHPLFQLAFVRGLGTRNAYVSASQDCSNKFKGAELLFGSPMLQPIPDLDRAHTAILIGTNPAVSQMSFVHAPRPVARLKAIEARGGHVFHVNPRRTETAKMVGEQVFIRPATDVFFLLSLVHVLFERGLPRRADARHLDGLDALRALVRPYPPSRTEALTGIPRAQFAAMVDALTSGSPGFVYCSTGVNQARHGTLSYALVMAANALTGNLDRAGGMLVPRGALPLPELGKWFGIGTRKERSRVGRYDSILENLPAAILPDEILTPGEGQIRALIVSAGNPVLSCANESRMREALSSLELLVTIDLFRNETGELADYVLPGLSFLERSDLPLRALGFAPTPYVQYTPAVTAPDGEQRPEWWIYSRLASAAGISLMEIPALQAFMDGMEWLRTRGGPLSSLAFDADWVHAMLVAPQLPGGLARLRKGEARRGVRLPSLGGGTFLGKRVMTKNRKVQLAPPALLDATRTLDAEFDAMLAERDTLKLISKREKRSHNSWMHNVESLVRGPKGRNRVYLNPLDAERLGLVEGATARVEGAGEAIELAVSISDALMPGAVAIPHGWGHGSARGLRVAQATSGANPNRLAPDGPAAIERLSGMTQLTGLPISIAPA